MINLFVIFFTFIFFVIIFVIHIFLWQIFRPKKHITGLIFIFVFIPVIVLSILFFLQKMSLNELIFILVLFFAISGVYIQTYPPIQAWSPSLYIVYLIGKNKKPIAIDFLKSNLSNDYLVNDRFNDLIYEGLIKINEETKLITLTKKGSIIANVFFYYRKLLALKEGDG